MQIDLKLSEAAAGIMIGEVSFTFRVSLETLMKLLIAARSSDFASKAAQILSEQSKPAQSSE